MSAVATPVFENKVNMSLNGFLEWLIDLGHEGLMHSHDGTDPSLQNVFEIGSSF